MKELTLEGRKMLDLSLWFFIIVSIGVTIALLKEGMTNYAPYTLICFLIFLVLMLRNNSKGLKMQKEQEKKKQLKGHK